MFIFCAMNRGPKSLHSVYLLTYTKIVAIYLINSQVGRFANISENKFHANITGVSVASNAIYKSHCL